LDSAGTEETKEIESQSLFTSIYIVLNLIMALRAASLYFVETDSDVDFFFAFYLLQNWFPNYGFVLNWLYRSTFFVLAYVTVTTGHQFIYVVQHLKFQFLLILYCMRYITDVEQYNSVEDHKLLKNEHFQNEIENRLKFCAKSHINIWRYVRVYLLFDQ
jgi:hypothetical protein